MTVLEFKPRAPSNTAKEAVPAESTSRNQVSFEQEKAEALAKIENLTEQGGETNPWLTEAFSELAQLCISEAVRLRHNSHPGSSALLQEAEGVLLSALEVATINGDTYARISQLQELGVVSELLGRDSVAAVQRDQAKSLLELQVVLAAKPIEERLRYDHPAVPSALSEHETRQLKKKISEQVVESLSQDGSGRVSDLEVSRASNVIVTNLLEATAQGRWIDDLFVLEMAAEVGKLALPNKTFAIAENIAYRSLVPASEHLELGLHELSLERIRESL